MIVAEKINLSISPTSIIFDNRDAVLVDMDVAMVFGAVAAPGAAVFLEKFGRRHFHVTNESAFSPAAFYLKLVAPSYTQLSDIF